MIAYLSGPIENAENDLYNLSQSGNSDRTFVNFGNALQGAVEIISEAIKERVRLLGYLLDLKILIINWVDCINLI